MPLRHLLSRLERARTRARAGRRCLLGEGAVVYDPERIVTNGQGREAIRVGASSLIRGELLTFPGGRISLGDWCYLGEGSRIWAAGSVEIGHRVLIAHLVTVMDNTTHPLDAQARHAQFRSIVAGAHPPDVDLGARPVRIGDDAWLGCNVVVLRGVSIGAGAIVGAGSVVTRDVPAGQLAVGNPARVVGPASRDPQESA